MLLSDKTIRQLSEDKDNPLISPYNPQSVSRVRVTTGAHTFTEKAVCSFGSSSYGYDLSLGNKFKLLKTASQATGARIIDPNNFDQSLFIEREVPDGGVFVLPPHACALGVVKELVSMRRNMTGVAMQKSTIARCFLEVTVTPLEAEWKGFLTLEFHNKTDMPIHLTPGMGIVQLLIFLGDQDCEVSYADRGGKYQNQPAEPVTARLHVAPVKAPTAAVAMSAAITSRLVPDTSRRNVIPVAGLSNERAVRAADAWMSARGMPSYQGLSGRTTNVMDFYHHVLAFYDSVVKDRVACHMFHTKLAEQLRVGCTSIGPDLWLYEGVNGHFHPQDVINALTNMHRDDLGGIKPHSESQLQEFISFFEYLCEFSGCAQPQSSDEVTKEATAKAVAARDWLVEVGFPSIALSPDVSEQEHQLNAFLYEKYRKVISDATTADTFQIAASSLGFTVLPVRPGHVHYVREAAVVDPAHLMSRLVRIGTMPITSVSKEDKEGYHAECLFIGILSKVLGQRIDSDAVPQTGTSFGEASDNTVADGNQVFKDLLAELQFNIPEDGSLGTPTNYLIQMYENILRDPDITKAFHEFWGKVFLLLEVGGGFKYGFNSRWKTPEELLAILIQQASLEGFKGKLKIEGTWEHAGYVFLKALAATAVAYPQVVPKAEEEPVAASGEEPRIATAQEAMVDAPATPIPEMHLDTAPHPIKQLAKCLSEDDGYALSWEGNLAMAFYDRFTPEQRDSIPNFRQLIDEGAAAFLSTTFGLDIGEVKAKLSKQVAEPQPQPALASAAISEQIKNMTDLNNRETILKGIKAFEEQATEEELQRWRGMGFSLMTKLEDLRGTPFYSTPVVSIQTYTDRQALMYLCHATRFILSVSASHFDSAMRHQICVLRKEDNPQVFNLIKADHMLQVLQERDVAQGSFPAEVKTLYKDYLAHLFNDTTYTQTTARDLLNDLGFTLVSQ